MSDPLLGVFFFGMLVGVLLVALFAWAFGIFRQRRYERRRKKREERRRTCHDCLERMHYFDRR